MYTQPFFHLHKVKRTAYAVLFGEGILLLIGCSKKLYNVLGGYNYYYTYPHLKVCIKINFFLRFFCANRLTHFPAFSFFTTKFIFLKVFYTNYSKIASNSARSIRSFSNNRLAHACNLSILSIKICFAFS